MFLRQRLPLNAKVCLMAAFLLPCIQRKLLLAGFILEKIEKIDNISCFCSVNIL